MEMTERVPDAVLRDRGDFATDYDLDSYELDKLVRLVQEHPAYNALPELAEE